MQTRIIWTYTQATLSKIKLIATVETILRISQLTLETPEAIWFAVAEYHKSQRDLTDCIIGSIAQHYSFSTVMTFDKKAAKSAGFELLK